MAEPKTKIDQLIELRNAVQARLCEWEANVLYWEMVSKKAKKNTQDKVDAENNIANNRKNVKKDTLYLKCIDILIEEAKAYEKPTN